MELFARPSIKEAVVAVSVGPALPESLKRSYDEAVDTFNSGHIGASAVMCRKTLEGIFKFLLPEDKRKSSTRLVDLIREVERSEDLPAPLKALANGIRTGGNLGAHFDPDNEPNEELVKAMLDLLGYLITYIYVLPREIESLEQYLDSRSSTKAPEMHAEPQTSQTDRHGLKVKFTADEIVERVVSDLRGMAATLSGDESPMESVWDEIKEQVQNEQSTYWEFYLQTMQVLIAGTIDEVRQSGEIESPPYCDDNDQEEMENAFLGMLMSCAEEEPIEYAPFDFKYFCYPVLDYIAYGEVIKRTGMSTCQAMVYSVAAPTGEAGKIHTKIVDCLLSAEEFASAQKQGWPEEWECT